VLKTFGVCDFSRSAVTDWRLWFLALMTATLYYYREGHGRKINSVCLAILQVALMVYRWKGMLANLNTAINWDVRGR